MGTVGLARHVYSRPSPNIIPLGIRGKAVILGIDPGVAGGMAVLDSAGRPLFIHSLKGNTIEQAVAALKAAEKYTLPFGICYLEKIQHQTGDGAQGSHTFGKVYGILYGAALARDLEVHDVYPMRWQERMGCLTQGNKNVSKRRAEELWPALAAARKITHYIADALLIAEYGRRRILDLR